MRLALKRAAISGALATVLVLSSNRASAEGFSIVCGQTRQEAIDSFGEFDTYSFSAAGGETVSITTQEPCNIGSCPLQPCWQVIAPPASPGGPAEPLGDPVCRGSGVRTLPRLGLYTISVSDQANNQTGAYALTLEALSGAFNGASNGPPNAVCARPDTAGNLDDGTQPIACGETKLADFEVEGETDTFTFTAAGGETVAISTPNPCNIGSCPLQSCWQLFAPPASAGQPAESVDVAVCRGQALRTLPRAGVYTIKTFDESNNQAGPYSLTLSFVSPPCPTCGDGSVDAGEVCDPGVVGGGCAVGQSCNATCSQCGAGATTTSTTASTTTSTTLAGSCTDAECGDGNPCTTDRCTAGACEHAPVADDVPCDNGNRCAGDVCRTGACADSATCDPSCIVADDGTPCDDGSGCTEGDACLAGRCTAPSEPCQVEFPCGGPGQLVTDCTLVGKKKPLAIVVIVGAPRSKCKVTLVLVDAQPLGRPSALAASTDTVPADGAGVVGRAKGKIKKNGRLRLGVKLNAVGRRLLADSGGRLQVAADVEVKEKGSTEPRLLRRLITLVR